MDILDDLARHAGRNASRLTKESYDAMEKLAADLGIPKYAKSLFRGIALKNDPAVVLSAIVQNKSFRLSSFDGRQRHAESWTKSPHMARKFASSTKHPAGIVLEARPSAKDIVIDLSDKRISKHARQLGYAESELRLKLSLALDFMQKEDEVVVRTGGRKYTFCRNIMYLHVKSSVMKESKTLMNDLVEKTEKNDSDSNMEDLRYDMGNIGRGRIFMFACKGGNVVYLPSNKAADSWFSKIKSK